MNEKTQTTLDAQKDANPTDNEVCRSNVESKTTISPIFSKQEVSEILEAIHYPAHWDTACYPTLADAIYEIVTNAGCSECKNQ